MNTKNKKERQILLIILFLLLSLYGCGSLGAAEVKNEPETENTSIHGADTGESTQEDTLPDADWAVMEGMRYLPDTAGEENGQCMLLKGRGQGGDEDIKIGEDNELDLVVECLVKDTDTRKMAVQILVDYEQVPLIVDGERYDTYYIESEDNVSVSKTIKLDLDLDRSVDHKITALLMNDLQVHACDSDQRILDNTLTIDRFLVCDTKKNQLADRQTVYEIPDSAYEDQFASIFLTQDESEQKRVVSQDMIPAKPGETIRLYYHLGGFTKSDETVVFVDIGEKQTKINGKDYLLFHEDSPTKILFGSLELTAPMEEGKYEIAAWAVNNPYGAIEGGMQVFYSAPRLTLSVEK